MLQIAHGVTVQSQPHRTTESLAQRGEEPSDSTLTCTSLGKGKICAGKGLKFAKGATTEALCLEECRKHPKKCRGFATYKKGCKLVEKCDLDEGFQHSEAFECTTSAQPAAAATVFEVGSDRTGWRLGSFLKAFLKSSLKF